MVLADLQAASAYSKLLGIEPLSLGDGVAEARLPMDEHLRNRAQVMHGGAIFSLLDITMGLACSSSHGFDRRSPLRQISAQARCTNPSRMSARRS